MSQIGTLANGNQSSTTTQRAESRLMAMAGLVLPVDSKCAGRNHGQWFNRFSHRVAWSWSAAHVDSGESAAGVHVPDNYYCNAQLRNVAYCPSLRFDCRGDHSKVCAAHLSQRICSSFFNTCHGHYRGASTLGRHYVNQDYN